MLGEAQIQTLVRFKGLWQSCRRTVMYIYHKSASCELFSTILCMLLSKQLPLHVDRTGGLACIWASAILSLNPEKHGFVVAMHKEGGGLHRACNGSDASLCPLLHMYTTKQHTHECRRGRFFRALTQGCRPSIPAAHSVPYQ